MQRDQRKIHSNVIVYTIYGTFNIYIYHYTVRLKDVKDVFLDIIEKEYEKTLQCMYIIYNMVLGNVKIFGKIVS